MCGTHHLWGSKTADSCPQQYCMLWWIHNSTTSRCRLPVGLLSSTERNPRLPCWYVNLALYPGHSMSYTRIIVCIVVHNDCRFQLHGCSCLHSSIWSYTATVHLLPRTWHLLSLQISKVDMPAGDIIETKKSNSFCSKWYRIWKHWTWEPYKQCYLSDHIVFERVDATHLLSSRRLQTSTGLRLYANTVPYCVPLMDVVGRQVIRKVADHYYKHS